MSKKTTWAIVAAWAWCASAQADFVAYNDFGGTSGGNTTAYTLSQSGLLKNYNNGVNAPVTLSVVAGAPAPATDTGVGSTPTAGDAFAIFSGKINMTGYIWYNNVVTVPYSSVRLDFTGLDQNKTYEIVLSANRNNTAYQGVDVRYTQFTILDMSAFTNCHSTGTTVVTVTQANDSVNVSTGYNTLNGHVARWTGIKSGPDGDFSVNVTAPTGTGASGDAKWYLGAMRLSEATYDFQQGLNSYAGTVDTWLQQAAPATNNGATTLIEWDGDDPPGSGQSNFGLLRFDNIFGNGAGQIPSTDTITSATLLYQVVNTGNPANVNEVSVAWTESETYNSFGGDAGVQADEYGTLVGSAIGDSASQRAFDVTSSIAAWVNAPANNRGWIFRPTGTDGVEFRSKEDATVSLRPRLIVITNAGTPAQKILLVKHQPYLQLGNAPLSNTGAGIGTTDQMVITWQTVESGGGIAPNDYFEAEYRRVGDLSYTPISPVNTINTGVGTRVNHYVTITGLNYADNYEYQVFHKRNPSTPVLINTYTGTFRTRNPAGSTASYSFAAYGDSADKYSGELPLFESVASRVATLQPAFVMLLGDNIYPSGTHDDLDARLEGAIAPNNSGYIRNHIEYFCMGNHDAGTSSGQPSLDNYFCPIPVLGVTSPVAPASGETAEKNYSFDYGMIHFTVIDSTAWGGPGNSTSREAAIVNWMTADLAASTQPWKLLIAHHPPKSYFGHSDTGSAMACEVIPAAIANGADLLLVGHSHNYQRSFPITSHSGYPGCTSGDVVYTVDESGTYTKGGQLIEVIAGTGGKSIGSGAPTSAVAWLAKALGSNNGGEVGPLIIDVSTQELHVKFTAADDGAVKDEFHIVIPEPNIALSQTVFNRTVFLGDNLSNDTFDVSNGGPDTINYSLTDDAAWLDVSPTSGASSGELDPINIIYSVSTLPGGNHSATITVTSAEAINSPRTITVNVNVVSVLPDLDIDGDVDQTDYGYFQECLGGPAAPPCDNSDFDLDNNIGLGDFNIWLNCHTGANIPANPACDD